MTLKVSLSDVTYTGWVVATIVNGMAQSVRCLEAEIRWTHYGARHALSMVMV